MMTKISDTLYAKYLKERENVSIIEDENYFIFYKINGNELFIKDMGVSDSMRGQGIGKGAILRLSMVAKENECGLITANVFKDDPGHMNTLISAFKTGFYILSAHNNIITIAKNLGE